MNDRDAAGLREIVRLCGVGDELTARGHSWYVADAANVPGLAAESLIVKIGENVARLGPETIREHPCVPWSAIKRMRDRRAHHYDGTDYEVVWDTLISDLPEIRNLIEAVLVGETND